MSVVGAGYMRWPPILMYHAVAQVMHDPNHICVSPKQFEAQMIYLKRRNLQGVSVQEAIHAMKAGNASRLVGLTFDDGYENFLQAALPVLKRLGFTATVFVIVGVLKEESSVDWKPRMRFLDVDGIREVTKRGMEIGSHSMSHTSLSGSQEPKLLRHEIATTRKILSEMLDKEVEGFCYPYGDVDDSAVQAVQQAGYTYACGASSLGGTRWWGSLYNIPRIHVGDRDGPLRLAVKLYAYSRYTKIAHRRGIRIARPLVRRYLSKQWFC